MRGLVAAVVLGAVLPGCLSADDGNGDGMGAAESFTALPPGAGWDPPVRVQQYGTAYEPSLAVDSFGRLYVTAHKGSPTNEGTRLSSWLWMSEDGGATWTDLPSPGQAHTALVGIEGDLAVDDHDRVYFVDTYLADNTLSVWQATASGVTWQSSRPVHATTGIDDRPWLAAAGDGILYYLGDHVVSDMPAPESLAGGDAAGSRWWFYRSMDGGLTWSAGLALGEVAFGGLVGAEVGDFSGMCNLDAPRDAPGIVGVVCTAADGRSVFVLRSRDHGMTWARSEVAAIESRPGYLFPGIAQRPDGSAVVAWIDDDGYDGSPGRLKLAVVPWEGDVVVQDVTPVAGSLGNLWLAVSPDGRVLVNVHASPAIEGPDHSWSLHAVEGQLDGDRIVGVRHALVDADLGTGAFALGHFIQNAFAPDGSASVAYQRQVGESAAASEIHVARLPPPGAP